MKEEHMGKPGKRKIALIGSGNIGGMLAFFAAQRELGDVVLFDIVDGMPQGKALDIGESAAIDDFDIKLTGTSNYADLIDAKIVVITAGVPRKPGMSRDDLIEINSKIMTEVAINVRTYCPDAIVIVVSNPLDAMVTLCQRITGFPANRVMGMAGVLDSSRFETFLAWELGVSVRDINAMVLGGHGDTMVPIVGTANVNGVPVMDMLEKKYGTAEKAKEVMDAIVNRVAKAGGEIVGLLKNGSAFSSPASSIIEMVEAVLHDQRRLLPVCALCRGEFNVDGYYMGVPAVIGRNGVERIVEFTLNDEEWDGLKRSYEAVKELVNSLPNDQ